MRADDEILLRILAETDAIFYPLGAARWSTKAPTNLYFARQTFRAGGVPLQSGASTGSGRVAFMSQVRELVDRGLVLIRKSRSSLWPLAKLTTSGEEFARSLVELPDVCTSLALVRQVLAAPCYAEEWVSERDLLGAATSADDRIKKIEEAAPALCRFWLETNSSVHGLIYYRATADGKAAAGNLVLQPVAPLGQQWAMDLYDESLATALQRLNTAPPQKESEIGMIPLSVSMGYPTPRPAVTH